MWASSEGLPCGHLGSRPQSGLYCVMQAPSTPQGPMYQCLTQRPPIKINKECELEGEVAERRGLHNRLHREFYCASAPLYCALRCRSCCAPLRTLLWTALCFYYGPITRTESILLVVLCLLWGSNVGRALLWALGLGKTRLWALLRNVDFPQCPSIP